MNRRQAKKVLSKILVESCRFDTIRAACIKIMPLSWPGVEVWIARSLPVVVREMMRHDRWTSEDIRCFNRVRRLRRMPIMRGIEIGGGAK